jgi:hypothetical protein
MNMKLLEDNKPPNKHLFAFENTEADQKKFQDNFNVQPFAFHHNLSADPRFEMDCIRDLALRIPETNSFNGKLAVDKGWSQSASSVENAIKQLEKGGSWIILKKIHNDPQYCSLLSECLAEVEQLLNRRLEPIIESRTMSLILSSAGQVTPYHVDADCNFLFQIRGSRAFYVFNGRDRSILTELEEERFWAGDPNAARYCEENQSKARLFELKPGLGVHVPVIFPHWVKNEQAISMSLSINFRFLGRIYADVHRANRLIRKVGLRPRAVGKSPLIDLIKGGIYFSYKMITNKCRNFKRRI